MPPDTTYIEIIETLMCHMAEKVAARLRRHAYIASLYSIGLRTLAGWVGGKYKTLPGRRWCGHYEFGAADDGRMLAR